jgi:hypothetical protein
MAGTGNFGGALTTAQAADLSSIAGAIGAECVIGTTTFFAVPEFVPKDVALNIGAGIRGTIVMLHASILDVPPLPIRAQTPITVTLDGVATAMLVKEAWREADGSLVRIICELAA